MVNAIKVNSTNQMRFKSLKINLKIMSVIKATTTIPPKITL